MEIPGLDHSIKESIIDEIIPHGLADDDINMLIKILKKYYIDDMLPLILLNNLLHHVLILDFDFTMAIDRANDLLGPHLGSIDRVQTVAAGCEMKYCLIYNLMMVIGDSFDIRLTGGMIRKGCL